MDETYIRVKGEWRYLYRAVNKHGETVDLLLTEQGTITKWGLGGFLLLVSIPLHPWVPATKCCAQLVV
jgi:hypothetical protein